MKCFRDFGCSALRMSYGYPTLTSRVQPFYFAILAYAKVRIHLIAPSERPCPPAVGVETDRIPMSLFTIFFCRIWTRILTPFGYEYKRAVLAPGPLDARACPDARAAAPAGLLCLLMCFAPRGCCCWVRSCCYCKWLAAPRACCYCACLRASHPHLLLLLGPHMLLLRLYRRACAWSARTRVDPGCMLYCRDQA
jgi:hypothetical protein